MKAIGQRIFKRWSTTLYNFACNPDADDTDLQSKLIKALTGSAGGSAVVAGILVSSFGTSPVVAALVAALLLQLFLKSAVDDIYVKSGMSPLPRDR